MANDPTDEAERLRQSVHQHLDAIRALLQAFDEAEADVVYRFYHQSFKVYHAQALIESARRLFESLWPGMKLHPWFVGMVEQGTRERFDPRFNDAWPAHTRAIVEAFWHCRYFLKQMVHTHDEPTGPIISSGWGAVLHLYQIR